MRVAALVAVALVVSIQGQEHEEDYQVIEKIAQEDLLGEQPDCKCSGWSPEHGQWKGTGHECLHYGWTTPWCYINPGYEGPGYEFEKNSSVYDGKMYAPCKSTPSTTRCEGNSNYHKKPIDHKKPSDFMDDALTALNINDPEGTMVDFGTYNLSYVSKMFDAGECDFLRKDPTLMAVKMVVMMCKDDPAACKK